MKMNLRLGVPTEALLKHPTACFKLSKAFTRVSDALSFGEYYLRNTKNLRPQDLDHISASIHTSGRSAADLAALVDDPDLRKEIQQYSNRAIRINVAIRKGIPTPKNKSPKGPPLVEIINRTKELRDKLKVIDKKVEDLCTVNPPPPPHKPAAAAAPARAGMSGVVHRKRPMYPRYFVASMGKSRR